MNQHPRFAEIRAAAIAAFGTPDSDGESYGQHRVAWDRGGITLLGAAHYVYFVHPRTEGAWWVVDDATMKPTVTLADAINASVQSLRRVNKPTASPSDTRCASLRACAVGAHEV